MLSDCDFIPSSYREARGLNAAFRVRVACIGVMVAVMGLCAFLHHGQLSSARAMIAEVSEQQQQIDLLLSRKQEMETERTALLNREGLIGLLDADVDLVVVFAEISRRMPPTVVLTELKATCFRWGVPDDPAPEKETPPPAPPGRGAPPTARREQTIPPQRPEEAVGDRLALIGVAADIPEVISFARALEGSPLFTGVQMEILDQTEWLGHKAQRFSITCGLREQVGGKP